MLNRKRLNTAGYHTYRDGDIVVAQGAPIAQILYLVEAGAVQIFKKDQDGEEFLLSQVHKGQVFGQMSLVQRGPRTTGARAIGKTRIISMTRTEFVRKIGMDPQLGFEILRQLCTRIHALTAEYQRRKELGELQ